MRLASHGKELILSDVCKNCADGSNDLQVIQCNASNGHGYAFGDGYINILGKEEEQRRQLVSKNCEGPLVECRKCEDLGAVSA